MTTVGEHRISNISEYNTEMAKSLIDKIFFMDKIEADVIVDIGCADGALIRFLQNIFPDLTYIGYDLDSEMIKIAKNNRPANTHFTDIRMQLDEWINELKQARWKEDLFSSFQCDS